MKKSSPKTSNNRVGVMIYTKKPEFEMKKVWADLSPKAAIEKISKYK